MAEILYDHYDIITEIRNLILNTIEGIKPEQVVRDTQNFVSLPNEAITIAVLFDRELDYSVNVYQPSSERVLVQNSVEVRIRLSFYGKYSPERSRIIGQLWRNGYAYERLEKSKPLYVHSRQRVPYINESNQYENRYVLDLALQYNPVVGYNQDFTEVVSINTEPLGG